MARIRSVKPSIWSDERFIELSRDARLLFLGMISNADDAGRLVASGVALIGAVFPHDKVTITQVEKWRDEIATTGLAVVYASGRGTFASLPGYPKHQRIQKKQPSSLPPPPGSENGSENEYTTGYENESRTRSRTSSDTETEGETDRETETETEPLRGGALAPLGEPDAGQIVAAFVNGATTAGRARPGPSLRGRVGKAAVALLAEGHDPAQLAAHAGRLGENGWDDLERELHRGRGTTSTTSSTTDQRVTQSLRRAAELRAQESA